MTYIKKLRKSFEIDYNEGFKQKIWFDNGYWISLVYHDGSYGLECALIHTDVHGIINDNKQPDDVIPAEAMEFLENRLSDAIPFKKDTAWAIQCG